MTESIILKKDSADGEGYPGVMHNSIVYCTWYAGRCGAGLHHERFMKYVLNELMKLRRSDLILLVVPRKSHMLVHHVTYMVFTGSTCSEWLIIHRYNVT